MTQDDVIAALRRWSERRARDREEFGSGLGADLAPLLRHCRWILDGDGADGPDSQKAYAKTILERWNAVRAAIDRGNADIAARLAVDIQALYGRAIDSQRGRKGGARGKRRAWAETLATHVAGMPPRDVKAALRVGIEIEDVRLGSDEFDLRFSVDGADLFCHSIGINETSAEVGKMRLKTFFDEYRPKKPQQPG